MTPDQALSIYRRMMAMRGQDALLRRYVMVADVETAVDCAVRIVDGAVDGDPLVGPTQQNEARIILLAEDVARATIIDPDALPDAVPVAWPAPPKRNDKIVVDGKERNVELVDQNRRRLAGVLIAYELLVKG
tara:strand:+ start:13276 stop:13671 length:396 start_codon:yes stop_codon:yes gene_type:complete